jgi:hypothetical protein
MELPHMFPKYVVIKFFRSVDNTFILYTKWLKQVSRKCQTGFGDTGCHILEESILDFSQHWRLQISDCLILALANTQR